MKASGMKPCNTWQILMPDFFVRDGIEAERNMQGFFMTYLSLNDYYYTAPELELSHGYCNFSIARPYAL